MKYDVKNATTKRFEEARHKDNTANTFAHELTDNMEHGNHNKYICIVKDDVIVHCYDNLVTDTQVEKMFTIENYSKNHKNNINISSHGEGLKMVLMQSSAAAILAYQKNKIFVAFEDLDNTYERLIDLVDTDKTFENNCRYLKIESKNYDKKIKKLPREIIDEIDFAKLQENLKQYNDNKPFGLIIAYKICELPHLTFNFKEHSETIAKRYSESPNKFYVAEYQHIIDGNMIEPIQPKLFIPKDDNDHVNEKMEFTVYDGNDGYIYFIFKLTEGKCVRCKITNSNNISHSMNITLYDLPENSKWICDICIANVDNNNYKKGVMLYLKNIQVNKDPIDKCSNKMINDAFDYGGKYFKRLRIKIDTTKTYIKTDAQKINSTMTTILKDIIARVLKIWKNNEEGIKILSLIKKAYGKKKTKKVKKVEVEVEVEDEDEDEVEVEVEVEDEDEVEVEDDCEQVVQTDDEELNKKDRSGYLYGLVDSHTRPELIKGGNSRDDFANNEKSLNNNYPRRHYPYGVKVICTIPVKDRFLAERLLFAKLQEFRIEESEWFRNGKWIKEQLPRLFAEVVEAMEVEIAK